MNAETLNIAEQAAALETTLVTAFGSFRPMSPIIAAALGKTKTEGQIDILRDLLEKVRNLEGRPQDQDDDPIIDMISGMISTLEWMKVDLS